jgi:hypothetical protein
MNSLEYFFFFVYLSYIPDSYGKLNMAWDGIVEDRGWGTEGREFDITWKQLPTTDGNRKQKQKPDDQKNY